jgi:hypothetical protein
VTPQEAEKEMRKIVRRSRHHPRKAEELGVELLCQIARLNGFYKVADLFERMDGAKQSGKVPQSERARSLIGSGKFPHPASRTRTLGHLSHRVPFHERMAKASKP